MISTPIKMLSWNVLQSVVLENFQIQPMKGHWKFKVGGGSQLPECLQEHMTEAKRKFPDGWGSNQKPSTCGRGYFLKSHNLVTLQPIVKKAQDPSKY